MKHRRIFFSIALSLALIGCSQEPTLQEPATSEEQPVTPVLDTTARASANTTNLDSYELVILGDSITAGYGLDNPTLLTDSLQLYLDEVGIDVSIINAGVSGDRMQDGLARFDWSVGPEADGVVIMLGGNDLLRGIDAEVTRASLEEMLQRARARGLWVGVAGLPAPANATQSYADDFNGLYQTLSAEYCAPLLPNFLDGVIGVADLNQDDGIHPTPEGVAIVVETVGSWLSESWQAEPNAC